MGHYPRIGSGGTWEVWSTQANNWVDTQVEATGDDAQISTDTESYQVSQSGTTVPTGTWDSSRPASVAQGYYLWTKKVLTWNNGQSTTMYIVQKEPVDGGFLVINNLTSTSTTDALSAAMGKELNERMQVANLYSFYIDNDGYLHIVYPDDWTPPTFSIDAAGYLHVIHS